MVLALFKPNKAIGCDVLYKKGATLLLHLQFRKCRTILGDSNGSRMGSSYSVSGGKTKQKVLLTSRFISSFEANKCASAELKVELSFPVIGMPILIIPC